MKSFILILVGAAALFAQSTHSVTLTITDNSGNPTGTQYNIYRLNAPCPVPFVVMGFTKITATPIGLTPPYVDNSVTTGTYCYYATATLNSTESGPSPDVGASVPAFPPTGVTVTVK